MQENSNKYLKSELLIPITYTALILPIYIFYCENNKIVKITYQLAINIGNENNVLSSKQEQLGWYD